MTRTVAWSALLALAVAGRPAPTRAAEAFTLANVTRQLRPQYPQIQPLADVLPPGVTAQEDVTYARAGDTALALDLYRPAGDAPFPAVLLVHAGGWDSGSREMERPFAKRLAGLGYVAVPVSYRLGPVARFPDPLHDLKAAVRWLRAHAAEHGVDPARIGVIGMSAGGQLAALLGATNGQADFEGDVGERGVSSAVQAVVDIDGLADFTGAELVAQQERSPSAPTRYLGGKFSERPDTWRAASALTHVGPRSAPTFFINSTAPTPILPGREAMRDRLHAAGVASELTVVPGTPHPFWLFQPWFEPTLAAADTFLRVHLAPAERTAPLTWRDVLRQPASWYAMPAARAVADTVLLYQFDDGGWPKNRDMTLAPAAEAAARQNPVAADEQMPTIDNNATHTQLRLLARVISAGNGTAAHRAAVERGLDYLLAAQYPNGGWPQFFPLRHGYYSHITFNDDAMAEVMRVLDDVAHARAPFAFVDADRRARAARAVAKGLECILRCQVIEDGRRTVWCAQHDEVTLAPAPARNFEPISLSGNESVGVVRMLMQVEDPSPEVIAAIEGAVAWFRTVAIPGLRLDATPGADGHRDRHAVADSAAPVIWARFYEIGTNRPIFVGRDRVFRSDYNAIERERRTGYAYLGYWPAQLLEKDFPRWQAKHHRS